MNTKVIDVKEGEGFATRIGTDTVEVVGKVLNEVGEPIRSYKLTRITGQPITVTNYVDPVYFTQKTTVCHRYHIATKRLSDNILFSDIIPIPLTVVMDDDEYREYKLSQTDKRAAWIDEIYSHEKDDKVTVVDNNVAAKAIDEYLKYADEIAECFHNYDRAMKIIG